jgi:glycosyltransferase involved in cell wall biosynthesis
MQLYKSYIPVVSIIIPSFNRGTLISRAIESVLKQTYTDWELVIVDDGSNDDTFSIISKYQSKNEKIRYLRHSNRKTALSTNVGIQASCGEYITFLGSDDEYKTDHIQLRMSIFDLNKLIDFIHGGVEIIGSPFVKDKFDLSREIPISECAVGGTFFGKRNLFFELGGFKDLNYSDDSDFFERVEKKYNVLKVDYPTYIYYRDTPDSICTNIKPE